jgi:hypothetical protein
VITGQDDSAASPTESGFTSGIPAQLIEQENSKIGKGFSNTSVMHQAWTGVQSSAAQAAVLAYAGNSTAGQWFIPSMNELNELCKYARGQTTGVLTVKCDTTGNIKSTAYAGSDLGGFMGTYWSSSVGPGSDAWSQSFGGGAHNRYSYSVALFVRPIRAF